MGNLKTLRLYIRTRRRAIDPAQRQTLSLQTAAQILCWLQSKPDIKHVATFLSLAEEIDTAYLNRLLWQEGYQTYLPYVPGKAQPLHWLKYTPDTVLQPDRCGINAPPYTAGQSLPADRLDAVVTPLVAWDSNGNRLGMGGGFYDRTFQGKIHAAKPWLIGMAYPCQYTDTIKRQPWDIPLDAVAVSDTVFNYP